jgi:hypothetical protein
LKDAFLSKLYQKLRRYIIIYFAGCLTAIIIIFLVVFSSSFVLAKTLRSLVPETKLTERIVERITEKELYRLLGPVVRMDINEIVKYRTDYFIKSYDKIVGRTDVATIIINKCLAKDIPINVGFGLAFRESGWDPNAINDRVVNGVRIIDRGLYQLSNTTFPKNTDWFNIEVNAELGLSKLKELYIKYGSWETAVTLYNAGSFGNLGKNSLEHLSAILQKERELDILFSDFYKSMEGT